MSTPGFAAGQIEELLIDLAARAALDGRTGAIRVVGGSVIALMNTDRRATRDIDAVLAPADQLLDIAHDMARLRGLKPDWLNDAVKGFVPPVGAEDRVEIHRVGDVSASIGSPEMLLAMKLYANWGIRDTEDIEYLLRVCEITSFAQGQEIYERHLKSRNPLEATPLAVANAARHAANGREPLGCSTERCQAPGTIMPVHRERSPLSPCRRTASSNPARSCRISKVCRHRMAIVAKPAQSCRFKGGVMNIAPGLAGQVRARRASLALGQEEMAELSGTSVRFIRNLEQGKQTVRLDKVQAVLDVLGLELTVRLRSSR